MSILKNIFRVFLTFILMDLILLLILSFTIKTTLVNDLLIETVKNKSDSFLTENNNFTSNNELNNILNNDLVNELLEKEEVQEFVSEFIDDFLLELSEDDITSLDGVELENKMLDYLKNHKEELSNTTGVEITDEALDKASEQINSIDNKKFLDQTLNNMKATTPKEVKTAIKFFNFITSSLIKLILAGLMIIDVILMIIIDKSLYKWVRSMSISLIIIGISLLLLSNSIMIMTGSITGVSIKTKLINSSSIILLIFGIIMLIMYYITTKFFIKEDKNDISKVS